MTVTTWVARVLENVKRIVIIADDFADKYSCVVYYNDGSNETLALTDIHEIKNN